MAGTGTPPTVMVGRYRIDGVLGRGGMGAVYAAEHTRLRRAVALKVLPAELADHPAAVKRFEREMLAVGRVAHPGIVQALDADEADGVWYLAMERVDGLDLSAVAAWIEANAGRPMPKGAACEAVRQAAEAMHAAHEAGLVHRDIKPSNLMLGRDGVVKVLDLGLATIDADGAAASSMTGSGQVMGTVDYMAPEQAAGPHGVDRRADVYALAATLYRLLAGVPPYAAGHRQTLVQKLSALATESVTPLEERRSGLPEELRELVARGLSRDLSERPATAADLAAALRPFCRAESLTKIAAGLPADRRPQPLEAAESTSSIGADPTTAGGGRGALGLGLRTLNPANFEGTVSGDLTAARRDAGGSTVVPDTGPASRRPRSAALLSAAALAVVAGIVGVLLLPGGGEGRVRLSLPDGFAERVRLAVAADGTPVPGDWLVDAAADPWPLPAGRIELALGDDAAGRFRLSPRVFELSDRGEQVVKLSRVSPQEGRDAALKPRGDTPDPAESAGAEDASIASAAEGEPLDPVAEPAADTPPPEPTESEMPPPPAPTVAGVPYSRIDWPDATPEDPGRPLVRVGELDGALVAVDGTPVETLLAAAKRLRPLGWRRAFEEDLPAVMAEAGLTPGGEAALLLADPATGRSLGPVTAAMTEANRRLILERNHPAGGESPPGHRFDGSDDYAEAADLTWDGRSPLTLEVRLTPEGPIGPEEQTVFLLGNPSNASLELAVADAGPRLRFRGPDGEVTLRGGPLVQHAVHLAAVMDRGSLRLYADGLLQEAVAIPSPPPPLASATIGAGGGVEWFGRYGRRPERYFAGLVHDVRLSNVARYAEDAHPPERIAADEDTLALYRFGEEVAGGPVADAVGGADAALYVSGEGRAAAVGASRDVAAAAEPIPEGGAAALRIPLDRFPEEVERLSAEGLTLRCFEPYRDGDTVYVAAAWDRGGPAASFETGTDADALVLRNAREDAEGRALAGLGSYLSESEGDLVPLYFGLWLEGGVVPPSRVWQLAEPEAVAEEALSAAGYAPLFRHAGYGLDGRVVASGLYAPAAGEPPAWWRADPAEADARLAAAGEASTAGLLGSLHLGGSVVWSYGVGGGGVGGRETRIVHATYAPDAEKKIAILLRDDFRPDCVSAAVAPLDDTDGVLIVTAVLSRGRAAAEGQPDNADPANAGDPPPPPAFGGSAAYAEVRDAEWDGESEATLEVRFLPSAAATKGERTLLHWGDRVRAAAEVFLTDGRPAVFVRDEATFHVHRLRTPLVAGLPCHVGLRLREGELRLWVNGRASPVELAGVQTRPLRRLLVGAAGHPAGLAEGGEWRHFSGEILEVRLSHTARQLDGVDPRQPLRPDDDSAAVYEFRRPAGGGPHEVRETTGGGPPAVFHAGEPAG